MSRILLLIALLLPATGLRAQQGPDAEQRARAYARSIGGQVVLTNSGFGLGASLRMAVRSDLSFTAETGIGAGKDAREVAFFDRFGRRDVLNKANHFLMVPLHVGMERRLFSDRIEDDFRPFVLITAGPTLGWESPYFKDDNENGILDPGERTYDALSAMPRGHLLPGFGGTVAIGAHFGRSNLSQGVRIGYSFAHFGRGVQLLERGIKDPQHFFGTPQIIVYFARLF
ncbi:MAG: hypothetical protein JJ896_04130 [Rhodothermales bacterium]|nr:hypothetical protein [Rhodothermales bacterium]MBO6778821.1 hypothetical protein [Rhodothermales bacterium]